jgi:acetoin utilization deacetylase AcuC-like enzyme
VPLASYSSDETYLRALEHALARVEEAHVPRGVVPWRRGGGRTMSRRQADKTEGETVPSSFSSSSSSSWSPDLVLFNAGCDILEGDALGRLAVTPDGLQRRDEMVRRAT